MTEEDKNERRNFIDNSTNVRLPISVLASLLVAVTLFLYAQNVQLRDKIDNRYTEVKTELERKANKGETADRYTGKDATKDSKATKASISALQNELTIKIEAVNYRLTEFKGEVKSDVTHIHGDIKSHVHKHSDVLHEKQH